VWDRPDPIGCGEWVELREVGFRWQEEPKARFVMDDIAAEDGSDKSNARGIGYNVADCRSRRKIRVLNLLDILNSFKQEVWLAQATIRHQSEGRE
jgi:hypothetical protein